MPEPQDFFKVDDISKINLDLIVSQLPGGPWWENVSQTQSKYVQAFLQSEDTLKAYGIDTALRLAHFLGQGLIETGYLRYTSENLNYSASALRKVFGKYFKTDEEAAKYARNPEKIANKVYGNRMGNGDEASGDGWKYRGRGFIQLTGKDNYTRFAGLTGLAIDTDPDLLSRDLKASIQVAAKFFEVNNLIQYADLNDASKVSRGINFGDPDASSPAHGESDRIWWTEKALALFQQEEADVLNPRDGGVLKVGSKGEKVEEFQRLLAGLNYPVGGIDGDYGPATRRVVVAFQEQAGLPITGEIVQATALAIDAASEGKPTSDNRTTADAKDLREMGDETPDEANKIGAGGAAIVIAAGVGGASEIFGKDGNTGGTSAPTPTPTPIPDATLTPTPEPTTTSTGVPDTNVPSDSSGGVNWILIGALVVIVIAAIWMFSRAGKMKKDQVQRYRDGKIV